jgi:hypothetical protein
MGSPEARCKGVEMRFLKLIRRRRPSSSAGYYAYPAV